MSESSEQKDRSQDIVVEHQADENKFVYENDGRTSTLVYERANGALDLKHTQVAEQDRGEGVGKELVETALEYAADEDLSVIPSCGFVEDYLEKNKHWQFLRHSEGIQEKLKPYWPIALLLIYGVWLGFLFSNPFQGDMRSFMHYVMGIFLLGFSYFKLTDLKGFQSSFAEYDIVAARVPAYGAVYPFIELLLGTAFLTFAAPTLTYVLTFLVMSISLIGVLNVTLKGKDMSCACMGTLFDLPVGTVTILEDASMAGMALLMLIF